MNVLDLVLELMVGRLVLALPKEDLEKVNEILKKEYGDKVNA